MLEHPHSECSLVSGDSPSLIAHSKQGGCQEDVSLMVIISKRIGTRGQAWAGIQPISVTLSLEVAPPMTILTLSV